VKVRTFSLGLTKTWSVYYYPGTTVGRWPAVDRCS
jgi:hypothetical protein